MNNIQFERIKDKVSKYLNKEYEGLSYEFNIEDNKMFLNIGSKQMIFVDQYDENMIDVNSDTGASIVNYIDVPSIIESISYDLDEMATYELNNSLDM